MECLTRSGDGQKVGVRWLWQAGARGLAAFIALALLTLTPNLRAVAVTGTERVTMPGSITAVPAAGASATAPHIARANLRPAEQNAPMPFNLSLKMRNLPELQARLANGETISTTEMAARYWPSPADYAAAADWLKQQGFTVSTANASHILISATGTVAQVQSAFQVTFSRVASDGVEFSSAVTAPSVPASLAPLFVGVNGLQPHLRKHPNLKHPANATGFVPPFFPKQIMKAYGADTLTVDGTGQTIAIIMSAFPAGNVSTAGNITNLTNFWTATNITRTGTYNALAVGAGPTASISSIDAEEVCLDVEWSSSIAPGANIRVYGTGSLADTDLDQAYQQVYNDAINHPEFGLHVVSMSYGGSESSSAQLTTDTQLFAQLVSAGITPLASSGDNGSTPGAENPASDPNVTGVGGTSITMNSAGVVASETGWSGSGGSTSAFFPKPSWQTGTGVSGSVLNRLVPDISAPADPNTGALIVWNNGANLTVGGTSWSAPTWAAFCALINQSRAINHEQPLGFLNPKLYPLLGTACFRDITSGNNGGFSAAAGYDLVTGLGVPVFPALLEQLTLVLLPPTTVEVNAGEDAVFSFIAASSATSFQWQRMPANSSTWSNLTEDATYSGTATNILTINATTAAMSGDQFQCLVGTGVTPSAALVVLPQLLAVSTLVGQANIPGTADGVGAAARLNNPNMAILDATGNLFIADFNNHAIRKATPAGNITTYAGLSGVSGNTNGVSSAARFNQPNAVAFDSGGNLYVADSSNNAIRKITPAGNVTTFAGSNNPAITGSNNGSGATARFNFPEGVAVAPNGTVYVADSTNHLIRKITPAGNVTTLAGRANTPGTADGTGSSARFNFPSAVAVDSSGNIFVADSNNNLIRKITPAGNVTTLAGSALNQGVIDGTGAFARFNFPSGIMVDGTGNIYVADTNNNSIRKVTQAGVVTTVIGQSGVQGSFDGIGAAASFNQPYGVVVNNTSGIIYITDTFNDTMRQAQALAAPQLQSQSSNLIVLAGNSANFSVTATGVPPPAYQWQRLPSGDSVWANLTDDSTYNGSLSTALTVNATTAAMDGDQFQCLITNAAGNITSVPALLTVRQPPSFTVQPTDQAVNSGDAASFTVAAAGFPNVITYQWQMNSGAGWGNLSDNTTVTGSNTTTLSINPTDTTLNGAQFRASASNGVNPDAISNIATLTVYPAGYQLWAGGLSLTGANVQFSARPFGDTIPNLARFAMNIGVPPAPGQLPSLSVQVISGVSYLTLTYNVNKALVGEQVVAQYSSDLHTWQSVSASNITQLADQDPQTSRFEADVAIPANGTVFLRLVIQPVP